jgi:hypothetical protein
MTLPIWIVELNNGEEHFFMECSSLKSAQLLVDRLEFVLPYCQFYIMESIPTLHMKDADMQRYYELRNILVSKEWKNPSPKLFVIEGGKQ